MRALSSLGIGLAIVSSLLFVALVAELYYIFWWKKKRSCNSNPPDLSFISPKFPFCFKAPIDSPPTQAPLNGHHASPLSDDPLHHLSSKDSLLKASINGGGGEEAIDAELMRLHSLSGPPRFLFTIKEETREDLESDDGRSRGGRSQKDSRGRSLGDLLHCAESPFMTPLSSPPLLGIGAQSLVKFESLRKLGFNPLFESSSSPPPKFKFLKEAEEKLRRRIGLLEASRAGGNGEEEEKGQVTVTITPLPPPPPPPLSSIKTEK